MLVTAVLLAVPIGGVAAWATVEFDIAVYAFFTGFLVATVYLYRKPIPSAAVSMGLYVLALELLLTPVLIYIPTILAGGEGEGVEAAGTFIGSIAGLFIWGFVFLIVAIVVAALGWFSGRRAKKKLAQRVDAKTAAVEAE